jgi:hypothetical protein
MVLKDWKRFHSENYDLYEIMNWDNKFDMNKKVTVSKYDFSPKPKNWQVQIYSMEEAGAGYPHTKVGITKTEALKLAKSYMRSH